MIDVNHVTDFNRNSKDLLEFWIFAVCVAGKQANTIAKKVHEFLDKNSDPWQSLLELALSASIERSLRNHKMGRYKILSRTIQETIDAISLNPNFLQEATIPTLEKIYGVGPKTSRFFVLHSRPGVRAAALDTHILKYLNANGIPAPKSTPSGAKYAELEQKFLVLADNWMAENSGKTIADFDLQIWKSMRERPYQDELPL